MLFSVYIVMMVVTSQFYLSMATPNFDLRRSNQSTEGDFYPARSESRECQDCTCPDTPTCPPGVSRIMDGCDCCKMCAKQLNEPCDVRMRCDHHKGLYCDMSTGLCKASPGVACYVGGSWYDNGQTFQLSCKVTCSCIDGDIACMPTCLPHKPSIRECRHPRLIHRRGECCEEWVCTRNGRLDPAIELQEHEVRERPVQPVVFRENCMVQTTEWSECSKSCGFGVSNRVSNDNADCKLKKEMRLCNIRPCSMTESTVITRRRSCRKTIRHSSRVRFSLSGCLSRDTYRQKYCGFCTGKCCGPKVSKTIKVQFNCESGTNFARNMMIIKKCSCSSCPSDFLNLSTYNRAMFGDMVHST
ncbi:CCN family member 2 [Ciona intestinalis]